MPKKIAAIINAVVPRDVVCKTKIDWSAPGILKSFAEKSFEQQEVTKLVGMSYTKICCELGGGDFERGQKNLEYGMKRKEFYLAMFEK